MSDGNDFWAQDGSGPEGADDTAPTGPAEGLVTPAAGSALMGFMTGGLPGLLEALDVGGSSSPDDDVEDPEALRKAEEAVARCESPARAGGDPIDEPWITVATQDSANDIAGLDDVLRALRADGVDAGWDPYDPRDVVNFMPPSAGLTARKLFSVVVPVSQASRARDTLYGMPPQGVTYAWSDPARASAFDAPPDVRDTLSVSSSTDSDDGFETEARPAATPVTSADPRMSDNRRLEALAQGGNPAGTVIIVLAALFVAGVAVALLMFRG